jgi:hypothetical protein
MPAAYQSFAFVITLAAVVNGLGIVRWLSGFAEYLRRRQSVQVTHYWVFTLSAGYQFLLHILFWWTLYGLRGAATINFLTFLYLLTGPILLFVGTAILIPDFDDESRDLRKHFLSSRATYSTVLVLLWLWAIFSSPIMRGFFAPTLPLLTAFLASALVLRISANPKIHSVVAVVNLLLLVSFIALYFMQLGGPNA